MALLNPGNRAIGPGQAVDTYAAMLADLAMALVHLGHIDQAQSRMNDAYRRVAGSNIPNTGIRARFRKLDGMDHWLA